MQISEHMKKASMCSSVRYEVSGLCLVLVYSAQQDNFSSPATKPH